MRPSCIQGSLAGGTWCGRKGPAYLASMRAWGRLVVALAVAALNWSAMPCAFAGWVWGDERGPAMRFTRVGIERGRWQINGMVTYPGSAAEGLLLNVRMVNAVFEDAEKPEFSADENTQEFLGALPAYAAHGVLAFTICLQGGMPGYEGAVNTAFAADGSLRPAYLERVAKVIEACDRLGLVVILSCFYQRQDQRLADEAAVRRAVQETARWIARQGYTNVLLEIANEYPHAGFDHAILRSPEGQCKLIELARTAFAAEHAAAAHAAGRNATAEHTAAAHTAARRAAAAHVAAVHTAGGNAPVEHAATADGEAARAAAVQAAAAHAAAELALAEPIVAKLARVWTEASPASATFETLAASAGFRASAPSAGLKALAASTTSGALVVSTAADGGLSKERSWASVTSEALVASTAGLLVSTSGIGDGRLDAAVAQASDFLLIHFNDVSCEEIPGRIEALRGYGKPIVCNEDDKIGDEAARAARISVQHGASWGLMLKDHNQRFPFTFLGARDDPAVYAALAELSRPVAKGAVPDREWELCTPEQVGLSTAALEQLQAAIGGRGCVVRHGRMAYSWGDIGQRGDVASAVKPVFTHFLLQAIADGRVSEFDEPVEKFEPRLAQLNPQRDHKDRRITWRMLACQTSGYGVREQPGSAFDYSDYNMALFADTLFGQVYQCTWPQVDERVLLPLLAGPLGCQDEPTLCAFGVDDRPGRLAISVRDLARFGLLYLRGGRWRERQLVPCWLVHRVLHGAVHPMLPRTSGEEAEMLPGQRSLGGGRDQTEHQCSYSFAWWVNGLDAQGRRLWPDAPPDTFAALGHWGRRGLAVIPSLDLVLSWNDGNLEGTEQVNQVLRLLAAVGE